MYSILPISERPIRFLGRSISDSLLDRNDRGIARIEKQYLKISWKCFKLMTSQLMTSYRKTNISKEKKIMITNFP